jgi:hypothetical protein
MRYVHLIGIAGALGACSGPQFQSADLPYVAQDSETITIDSGAEPEVITRGSLEAAPETAQPSADAGPCRSDADCPALCRVSTMRPVCVGSGGPGAFCACTCDGSPLELAGCADLCAGVQWSTCSTCAASFYGRSGVCGCSTGTAAQCVARTCDRPSDCASGVCSGGWCQL